jgi:hypothetical protein
MASGGRTILALYWQKSYVDAAKPYIVLTSANLQLLGYKKAPLLSFSNILLEQEFFELQDLLTAGYDFDDLVFYFQNGDNGSVRHSFMADLSLVQKEELWTLIASKPTTDQLKSIFGPLIF